MRNFTPIWVSSLRSAKKNSVKKDVSCEAYLMAVDLDLKEALGALKYNVKMVKSCPTGQGLAIDGQD